MATTNVYVDRGDNSSHDFTEATITTDGAWHDMDLSSIVPAGASLVLLRVSIQHSSAGSYIQFRENGNSNGFNVSLMRIQYGSNWNDADMWVPLDANRIIEYQTSNVSWSSIDITIRGWIISLDSSKLTELTEDTDPTLDDLLYSVHDPGGTPTERKITIENLLKNLTPGMYVDRGDPSSHDFTESTLTTDGAWHDMDLSSIVPAGATIVHLRVQCQDNATGSYIQFRENGNSNGINVSIIRTQYSSLTIDGDLLVQLDSNRVIEYQASNLTFSSIDVTVRGWFTNVNQNVLGFSDKFIDRGDPSAYDWTVGSFTTDATWRDLDCSSIVPAGATHIMFRIGIVHSSTSTVFSLRKKGNSNSHNAGVWKIQNGSVDFSAESLVPCDENRFVQYYGSNVSFSTINVVIKGWIIDSKEIALDYAPNELINPEFAIWQEGISIDASTTPANDDDTYICDQWILLSDGNDIVDVSRGSSNPPDRSKYYLHAEVETASKKFGFFQPLENENALNFEGEYASLRFEVKGNLDNCRVAIVSWSGTADSITSDIISAWNSEGSDPTLVTNWTYENTPSDIALTTSWVEHKIEGILIDTSGMTNLGIFIWVDDTDGAVDEYIEIGKVKLEVNSICTKFIKTSKSMDIERCQRYFEKSYDLNVNPGTADRDGSLMTWVSNANAEGICVRFATRKMKVPTVVSYSSNTGTINKVYDGSGDEDAGIDNIGEAGCRIYNNGTVTLFVEAQFTAVARL